MLKNLLFSNDKRIAYITGTRLYNWLGLTTQVPKVIKIASRDKRISASVGNLKGQPVKSYVDVSDKNYYLLGILDAMKDFNQIPDLDKKSGIKLLAGRIKNFNAKEIDLLVKYALKYPPRTRAFLGALLETNSIVENLPLLKKSLNPLSQYQYNMSKEVLPTAKNWNIT